MKKFDFVIDTERFGKNFQAEFSLSEDFLSNLVTKINAARDLGIWHITILDKGSQNNMSAGLAALSVYPGEKFPMIGVLKFEGGLYSTGGRDEDGEDVQDKESYYFHVSIYENNNISVHPAIWGAKIEKTPIKK